MSTTVLFDYPKSSASYRVRIALNLAGINFRTEHVNLLDKEHKSPEHLQRNPQGLVPVLDIDGHRFTQSLAIIEYLDATRDLGFLPKDPVARAKVQALVHSIAIDLHPVCNLSVAGYATGGRELERTDWMRHFIEPGLAAFEGLLSRFEQALYCTGQAPTLADICLIPQLYNANRWGADYSACNHIKRAQAACDTHDAFLKSAPSD